MYVCDQVRGERKERESRDVSLDSESFPGLDVDSACAIMII